MQSIKLTALTCTLLAIAPIALRAQEKPVLIQTAQVQRGETVFNVTCLSCHARADFTKHEFTKSWHDRPLFELVEGLRASMPEDKPGSLTTQEYLDVVVYIFKMNGTPEGGDEIKPDDTSLKSIRLKMKDVASEVALTAARLVKEFSRGDR